MKNFLSKLNEICYNNKKKIIFKKILWYNNK